MWLPKGGWEESDTADFQLPVSYNVASMHLQTCNANTVSNPVLEVDTLFTRTWAVGEEAQWVLEPPR